MSLFIPICPFYGGSIPDGVTFVYVRTGWPDRLMDVFIRESYGNREMRFTERTDIDGIATLDFLHSPYKEQLNAYKGTFQLRMYDAGTNNPLPIVQIVEGEQVQYDALTFDVRILNPIPTTVFIGPSSVVLLPDPGTVIDGGDA